MRIKIHFGPVCRDNVGLHISGFWQNEKNKLCFSEILRCATKENASQNFLKPNRT